MLFIAGAGCTTAAESSPSLYPLYSLTTIFLLKLRPQTRNYPLIIRHLSRLKPEAAEISNEAEKKRAGCTVLWPGPGALPREYRQL